jgi:predicted kinase
MTKKVIILKGLPACGKTTYCKELMAANPGAYKRINKDDLRAMIDDGKWSKHNESFILKVRDSLILTALREGCHVLVDDTSLHPKHETAIRELVKGVALVEIKDFTDVPLETCLERDRHRQNYVGEQVIRKMYNQYLWKPTPTPVYIPELPYAIICDLDGTLAIINGRNPYDAEKCEQDIVNAPIASILEQYKRIHRIFLVSGRSEQFRPQTERWLQKHGLGGYDALYMRPDGDARKDALVKRELYKQHIQGKYNIRFILDDRNQMVEMWRSLGLTCLQVADGDY